MRVCAIEDGGAVRCWGDNTDGALAIDDTSPTLETATTISDLPAVVEVAVGREHQLALTSTGVVWGWGTSTYGELGAVNESTVGPAVISSVPSASAIAASDECSCAIVSGGTVECWGAKDAGCLGNVSTMAGTQTTPMAIPTLPTTAVQIRMSSYQQPTCARLANGDVWCWDTEVAPSQVPGVANATNVVIGTNVSSLQSYIFFQVGGDVLVSKRSKGAWTTATSYVTGVTDIAAGDVFVGVRSSDGAVVLAPLYDVSTLPAPTALAWTPPGSQTVVEIEAGFGYSYGGDLECLKLSGSVPGNVYCWGDDGQGALGINSPENYSTPQTVPTVTGASWLATTQQSTNVVIGSGSVLAWGAPAAMTESTYTTPTALTAAGTGNTAFRTNDADDYSYALKSSGGPAIYYEGQSKTGLRLLSSTFTDFTDVVEMQAFDVGLRSGNTIVVYAATDSSIGVFGNGTQDAGANSFLTVPNIMTASAIAAYCDDYDTTPAHICAIVGGAVQCWGWNMSGEVGVATSTNPVLTPTPVAIPGNPTIVSIAAGRQFTCAVTSGASTGGGDVYCWGENGNGQLGTGSTTPERSSAPLQVQNVTGALGVTARNGHACVWLYGGGVQCWGSDEYGQLGDGAFNEGTGIAVTPLGLASDVVQVSAGDAHTCARHMGGTISCWGSSYNGQVGTGLSGEFALPQAVLGL